MQALSDEQLCAKTKELQDKYQDGQLLDNLLVEAFAVGSQDMLIAYLPAISECCTSNGWVPRQLCSP